MNTYRMADVCKAMLLVLGFALIAGCGGTAPAPPEPPPPEPGPAPVETEAPQAPAEELPAVSEGAEEPEAAIEPVEPAPVAETTQETQWISLFNGVDLAGWRNARDPEGENKWFVEDGALTNTEHANDIATVDEWKDFELKLEYKIVPGGNSGVYLRGRLEVQVLDSYNETEVGTGSDGAVYGLLPPLVKASKPAGEWNQLEVVLVGNRLTAKLNGQLIHDDREIVDLTGGALPGGIEDPGPLMLQGDHGKVWYRNIELRPIVTRSAE